MTYALHLITEVKVAGGWVEIVQPDKLRVFGPAGLVQQVRDNKPAIIEAIKREAAQPSTMPCTWAKGFAILHTMARPTCYTPSRWRQVIDDGRLFMDQWARTAIALGWRVTDAFGVHPAAPEIRLDGMGLVPLLHGGKVCALTQDTARIDCGGGITQTFTRKTMAANAVVLWELA